MGMMKTVLVVDDDPDVVDSVRMILEVNGYKVYTAYDGDECIEVAGEANPDLILLDIMMPGTPAEDVIKKLRNIKIAFMSVVRVNDARKRGLCAQANIVDFFQKPFNISDLIDRVEYLLRE